EPAELSVDALLAEDHRVGQREERVVARAALDEGSRERALAFGSSDLLGIEAEELGAQGLQLVELEQALELPAKDVGRRVHGTLLRTVSGGGRARRPHQGGRGSYTHASLRPSGQFRAPVIQGA